MGYYRFEVPGGEFVVQGDRYWQLTFNGVQIGGLYRTAQDALGALTRVRSGQGVGPNLTGIADPPFDLRRWTTHKPTAEAGARRVPRGLPM